MDNFTFSKERPELESFRYLWKLDDKEWVRQRKADWKHLAENGLARISAKGKRQYKDYFLQAKKDDFIGAVNLYFLTPFDSAESARDVFWSKLIDYQGREELLLGYLERAATYGEGISWIKDDARYFADGVLGNEYSEVIDTTSRPRNIAPDPGFIGEQFLRKTFLLLKGDIARLAYLPAIDYYISTIKYANKGKLDDSIGIDVYIDSAQAVLKSDSGRACALDSAKEICQREETIRANWAMTVKLP
ncbi:hypothetical protein [Allohahella sp. A8]|uniref:hypothetical protein n=1 Tax=Allohahella sp. A8 TaxID=3141461 RepID=UPI003A81376C